MLGRKLSYKSAGKSAVIALAASLIFALLHAVETSEADLSNAQLVAEQGPIDSRLPLVGVASTPSGSGRWLVASDGGVFSSGNAQFYGSMGGHRLNLPIVGMAATPTGGGYWLVASDGGIFSFGDAGFFGSTGSLNLNKPVVGMAATPSGNGYWLVASDGGVFAFGDAQFYGSTGAIRLNQPIVAMSSTGSGQGYWMVASDGGIFAFGNAPFFGSTGSIRLNQPISSMIPTPDNRGYWLAASDGGVFTFGNAAFLGSGVDGRSRTVAIVPDGVGGYSIVRSDGSISRPIKTIPPPSATSSDYSANHTLIFKDEFDTDATEGNFLSAYRAKWDAYPTSYRDTSRKGQYNPNILSVNNGVMRMRLHTNSAGVPQVAAPEPLINGYGKDKSQLYGRYEVRFRADAVDGYKTAWLLWPKSEVWPRDGEIDFPEGDLNGTISAFTHRQNGANGGDQDAFSTNKRFTDWHTAIVEWNPVATKYILDGEVIGTSTHRIPNTPMRWVLQTETELNNVYPDRNATGSVEIDYVKAWKYTPST